MTLGNTLAVLVGASVLIGGCQSPHAEIHSSAEVAVTKRDNSVGSTVPAVKVETMAGEQVVLSEVVSAKPTVLVFYRGGWCVYCNKHLSVLKAIHPELTDMGFQLVAVSPDRPAKLGQSAKRHTLDYTLLSDSSMEAARLMGLAFKVDDATFEKYRDSFGIDIEADSGRKHHLLPVPAVFIVGPDGLVTFEHADPDYTERLSAATVLSEARKAIAPDEDEEKDDKE